MTVLSERLRRWLDAVPPTTTTVVDAGSVLSGFVLDSTALSGAGAVRVVPRRLWVGPEGTVIRTVQLHGGDLGGPVLLQLVFASTPSAALEGLLTQLAAATAPVEVEVLPPSDHADPLQELRLGGAYVSGRAFVARNVGVFVIPRDPSDPVAPLVGLARGLRNAILHAGHAGAPPAPATPRILTLAAPGIDGDEPVPLRLRLDPGCGRAEYQLFPTGIELNRVVRPYPDAPGHGGVVLAEEDVSHWTVRLSRPGRPGSLRVAVINDAHRVAQRTVRLPHRTRRPTRFP